MDEIVVLVACGMISIVLFIYLAFDSKRNKKLKITQELLKNIISLFVCE